MHRRFHHGLTDSTNERAFAAIDSGSARHGDVHVAHGQTAGRGRRGQVWHSAEGAGLYVSLVLAPATPPPAPALTVAGGLAALDTARAFGLARARLDWPNDLMVADGKLAGILVETRGLDPARPRYVLGVGINVAQRHFPPELTAERCVTSFALEGVAASIPELEAVLVDRIDERLAQISSDPGRLTRDYLAAGCLDRGLVRATTAETALVGEVVELTFGEGLTLRDRQGSRHRIALEFLRGLESDASPTDR